MSALLRPLGRTVTYTRWLHLWIGVVIVGIWRYIDSEMLWVPALLVGAAGLVPAVRTAEGLQARHLLFAAGDTERESAVVASRSASWGDRGRVVLWMELRLLLGTAVAAATVQLPGTSEQLIRKALAGGAAQEGWLVPVAGQYWWYLPLAPLPLLALYALVVGAGELITAAARLLLGPSAAERTAALEERTELLLERNRIARELHDSIGHALTVAVVQAGAARAAGDPVFTERALGAIEETGRAALEDLERVLVVLREERRPVSQRPVLADADRLLESARDSGAEVSAEVSGPLVRVPGPISREGYRIVQESLTNALRHAGPVPVRLRIAVSDGWLALDVSNPLSGPPSTAPAGGGGLRGIRERAALLGGRAETGPADGEWRVRVRLPLDGLG
ncbi:sensor histidine kinase [Streptomyces sp. GC420]|uniref:sensor histidine kinase n=1 Tax=Streptomyces sp. GC420 TaxID=2697568 RepID=UPI0014152985|nr:histidine kinase [Streptomyces sp. GC420]NBM14957.1 two-component sensor histidine kinase [Streptomyces sp. GC420]